MQKTRSRSESGDSDGRDTDGGPRRVVSAGGVVYRTGARGTEIVICGRLGEGLWALPKGSPLPGEALRDTAAREVEEETGLQVTIEERLGHIEYEFVGGDGTRYDKRVEHHLMRPTGGALELHDKEFDAVRWAPVDEALRLLRFENEREVVRRAVRAIEQRNGR